MKITQKSAALNWKKWAKSPFFTTQKSAPPRAPARPNRKRHTSVWLFPKGGIGKDAKGSFAQRALNRKKSASRFFIHKSGGFLTASLLCAALLFPYCANVKGIFTDSDSSAAPDDTTPAKESDPRCANAPQSSGFNDGDGMTEDSPFLICTYAQLGMMRDDLSARYELGDNIDASASCGGDCGSPSGSGWTPVGEDGDNFSGTLDGKDRVISNLTVNITWDYGGLFGYTDSSAEVRNVGLSDVDITANDVSGGLVGENRGSISNSYAAGAITGSGNTIGGLVGINRGNISNSYATGAITSSSGNTVGGLAGLNAELSGVKASISNSYATGTATGNILVGGLVGINTGTVSNSYATGEVTATSGSIGGLVGLIDGGGTISDSYWDTDTTGLSDACSGGCTGTTGLTTTEMQAVSGDITGLGAGFQINAGSYPKVKKCTVCTGTLEFSDELVPGQ